MVMFLPDVPLITIALLIMSYGYYQPVLNGMGKPVVLRQIRLPRVLMI